MFREFSNSAAKANEEVKRFKQLMDDENTKKIFAHTKESRAANPKGITPVSASSCSEIVVHVFGGPRYVSFV